MPFEYTEADAAAGPGGHTARGTAPRRRSDGFLRLPGARESMAFAVGLAGTAVATVQSFGWYLVAAVLLYRWLRPKLATAAQRRAEDRSLTEANDPERRRLLDIDRRRVRAEQQKAAVERRAAHEKAEYERKQKRAEDAKKAREEGRLGGNPLDGHGGTGGSHGGMLKQRNKATHGGGGS